MPYSQRAVPFFDSQIEYTQYMNFIYSYTCPDCKSELEFKSMHKASNEVVCMCGSEMKLIRYWAKSVYIDGYPQANKLKIS